MNQETKTLLTVLASATALIGAATSFVKASDKSVEQESYEVLSRKIIELQNNQVTINDSLFSLHRHIAELQYSSGRMTPFAAPSSSNAVPSLLVPSSFPTKVPVAYVNGNSMNGNAMPVPIFSGLPPLPSPPSNVSQEPPPAWKSIRSNAQDRRDQP